MNIGLDARVLVDKKTGIGYYLNDLLINILNNDTENTYYLFSDRKIVFDSKKYKNVKLIEDKSSKIFKKTIWYVTKLPRILKTYGIDVFWGTQHVLPIGVNRKIRTVLTMHDLVAYEMPETMNRYNKIINRILIPYSLKRADKIISVSYSTKKGIMKYFPDTKESNIKVIYEDSNVTTPNENAVNKYFNSNNVLYKKNYLLYVGTIEPRKNVDSILKAFEKVRETMDIKLVLCGKLGWKCEDFMDKINQSKYSEDIIYKNYISDEEKFILMQNCFLFLFPSLYEGFGLPVVEAMKLGAIPLVSNSSSLDELIEIEELKFETRDYIKLAEKIVDLYKDKELYSKCKCYCEERSNYFNWNEFSKEYIKEFKMID